MERNEPVKAALRSTGKESRLEKARRHVREGKERLAHQTAVLEELRARGADTPDAERMLRVHAGFLQIARQYLVSEEQKSREELISVGPESRRR